MNIAQWKRSFEIISAVQGNRDDVEIGADHDVIFAFVDSHQIAADSPEGIELASFGWKVVDGGWQLIV